MRRNLTPPDLAGDPANLPIRVHEMLEDALRDHLSEIDDEGGHAEFEETFADPQVAGTVLHELSPLITSRDPGLIPAALEQMGTLHRALMATYVNGSWEPSTDASLSVRQHVDAAIGALLEMLAIVPDLLEVAPTR